MLRRIMGTPERVVSGWIILAGSPASGGVSRCQGSTYTQFVRCGAPSDVWVRATNNVSLCVLQVNDSEGFLRVLPEMWASAHKRFVAMFAAISGVLLNKVIHRPVESIGNPKIIDGLQRILMFYFNFARLMPAPESNRRARGGSR
jgi:hypothetical protein